MSCKYLHAACCVKKPTIPFRVSSCKSGAEFCVLASAPERGVAVEEGSNPILPQVLPLSPLYEAFYLAMRDCKAACARAAASCG